MHSQGSVQHRPRGRSELVLYCLAMYKRLAALCIISISAIAAPAQEQDACSDVLARDLVPAGYVPLERTSELVVRH
jgi:hypothetical protein